MSSLDIDMLIGVFFFCSISCNRYLGRWACPTFFLNLGFIITFNFGFKLAILINCSTSISRSFLDSGKVGCSKNIILSPHLGASTKEAKEGVSKAICEQVRDYLSEQKLTNVVNMPISSLSVL